ncbi:MAG TPA: thiamine phosphate synthase [Pyrinomonadaceae bacterium]
MTLNLSKPILYLITPGETRADSNAANFSPLLTLVRSAAAAGFPLIQLREKSLNARALYELTARAALLTRGTDTRLLVNDRADIARAAGADGVHLTSQSLETRTVRRAFGADFIIGVSTHSLEEARAAREQGADFAVLGPVFDTPSKRVYGPPLGLELLSRAAQQLSPFPLLALGGVTVENSSEALRAGARGIAAIRLFADPAKLDETARAIRELNIK